jgi:HPt (histidine-containing phosphotransfer) domain-containing protein
MPSTPDHDLKGASPTSLRVLIVSGDSVAAVLAARLFERLGHPRPERVKSLAEAAAERSRFELLLVDADLPHADTSVAAWMQAGEARPRIIAMSSAAADMVADTRLRKPLTLDALAAALVPEAGASARQGSAVAIWTELQQQFGAEGATELVTALVDDLPTQQQRMSAALQGSDLDALKRVAHALRGVGLQLDVAALVQLSGETEGAARDGRKDAATELGARLIRQYEGLVEGLRNEAGKR